jgi:hypothetical protein
MTVEAKIKSLLESRKVSKGENLNEASHVGVASKASTPKTAGDTTKPKQGSSQDADVDAYGEYEAGSKISADMSKDTTLNASEGGDKTTKPRQGDSKEATCDDLDGNKNGKIASSKASKDSSINPVVGGDKTNDMQGDSRKATYKEVDFTKESIDAQLNDIFGEDLTEEFKQKATEIFESVVIARVNSEILKLEERLEEEYDEKVVSVKEELAEKIDNYLNYIVEEWMEENTIAIESGIKSELTNDFMEGLKNLFKEHYIEIPDEKVDVIESMAEQIDSIKQELNEAVNKNIEFANMLTENKRNDVFSEVSQGLVKTDVERFEKLIEGIEFNNESIFREKLKVIKESNFNKELYESPEENLDVGDSVITDDRISKYAQAISNYKN